MMDQKLDYIQQNSAKEMIVYQPEQNVYSSAKDNAGNLDF